MKPIIIVLFLWALFIPQSARAEHFVQLKNGKQFACAILRQDAEVVVTTSWEERNHPQPSLQVYALNEVKCIWYTNPSTDSGTRIWYRPRPSGREVGGGFSLQQWAETETARRSLLMVNLHGGYTILDQLGLELDASFSAPFGGKSDSAWHSLDLGYQATMNIVAHPVAISGFVPFALAGGGAAVGVPIGDLLLTSSNDIRNLVVVGVGAKWGWSGFGFRTEVRHHFYTWTPDAVNEFGVRAPEQSADATILRLSMFFYK